MKQDFNYYGMKKIFQYNPDLSIFLYNYYFTFEHNKEIKEWCVTVKNDENTGITNRMLEIIHEIFSLQDKDLLNLIRRYLDKFIIENGKWFNEQNNKKTL